MKKSFITSGPHRFTILNINGECGGIVVEHQTLNKEVLGSIPTSGTVLCP